MFQAQIFTLYPEIFPGPLSKGLYGKALSKKLWNLSIINIRDAATDKHKTVDDTPYGGGSGMLIRPDVIANSLDKKTKSSEKVIYLSPKGKMFNQDIAEKLSKQNKLNLISERGERDLLGSIKQYKNIKILYLHAREIIERLGDGSLD